MVDIINGSAAWRTLKPHPIETMTFPMLSNAMYVRNHKAASQTLWDFLPLLLGHHYFRAGKAHVAAQMGLLRSWTPSAKHQVADRHKQQFTFSFVREPIEMALAGYHEVEMLARTERRRTRRAEYELIPCTKDRSLERYSRFLQHLEQADVTGPFDYHAYPQALKLATTGVQRLDFIGRVESFEMDVRRLIGRLRGFEVPSTKFQVNLTAEWIDSVLTGRQPYLWAENTTSESRLYKYSYHPLHANRSRYTSPCALTAEALRLEPLLMCRVCNLYATDYLCLRDIYPMPRECHTCTPPLNRDSTL